MSQFNTDLRQPSVSQQRRLVFATRSGFILLAIAAVAILSLFSWGVATPRAFAAVDPPTCTGSACNGLDPFTTLCAGQDWDTWSMLASSPLRDAQGRQLGVVRLWWSKTCSTYWSDTVFHLSPGASLLYATSAVSIAGEGIYPRFSGNPAITSLSSFQYYGPGKAASGSASICIYDGEHVHFYYGHVSAKAGQ